MENHDSRETAKTTSGDIALMAQVGALGIEIERLTRGYTIPRSELKEPERTRAAHCALALCALEAAAHDQHGSLESLATDMTTRILDSIPFD